MYKKYIVAAVICLALLFWRTIDSNAVLIHAQWTVAQRI